MSIHQISKSFEFSYAHRLLDYNGRCRFLHGHNAVVEVSLAASTLDTFGMVIDVASIDIKQWVDENLDHKVLLYRHDPLVSVLEDAGQRVYTMDAHPTAENIACLLWDTAHKAGLPIAEARLRETSTICASYRADSP
ncbi:6-pyruvoyl tetrahydropterin synthase family protein [Streptomyces lavendulae]|uniref:6-pyruvoyl trahydropterin synthase family protein n=1 Tax=Streptomyces lavendulae TaxID=1914 RepID=UPI0033DCAC2D